MMRRTLVKKAALAVMAVGLGLSGAVSSSPILPVGAESPPEIPRLERGPAGVDGEITRLYIALLDRQPEAEGLEYWVERRRLGMPLTDMVAFFRTSPEFQVTFASQVDASTQEWVEFMYVEVLERPSEQTGKDFWVERVASGQATREDLIIFFADSVEFRVKTKTGREGLLALVDASETAYAAESDYRYERSRASIVGQATTTMTVTNGAVTERSYVYTSLFDPTSNIEWTESGAEIGSHGDTEAEAPLTAVELHDRCRVLLDSIDSSAFRLLVEVGETGRMYQCGGRSEIPIADGEDGIYLRIENYSVLGS